MPEALEEIEPIADQPVHTGYRVVIEPLAGRVRAIVNDTVIADSVRSLVMRETRLPWVYYFPREDVRMDLLHRNTHRTHCPFKGDASYWSLDVDGRSIANAAWSYEEPFDESSMVKDHIAFDWNAVDRWEVNEKVVDTQPVDDSSTKANPFVDWLVQEAWQAKTTNDFVARLADALRRHGLPLWRLRLLVRTLNPQLMARGYTWQRGIEGIAEYEASHDTIQLAAFRDSPFAAILSGEGGIRRKLEGDAPRLDYPILKDLIAEGATDYVAMPLRFSDGQINIITLVSDRPGGFSTDDLGQIYEILPSLSRQLEVHAHRVSSMTLMKTYLGRNAGERVMNGLVKRGDGENLHAVIWFSDLRDSTALAASMSREDYLATLNQYFDAVAGAVIDHNGEVLKFIGDAVLAIFPISDPDAPQSEAGARALDAVVDAQARMAAVNRERTARGEVPLAFGTALHRGDLTFGNIGTVGRLDFTVIGPAVNEASRIEALTKSLGMPVLVSQELADSVDQDLVSLGQHELRGVMGTREIFAPRGAPTIDPPAAHSLATAP